MMVLFETPAGFAIFRVLNEKKLAKVENLSEELASPDNQYLKLEHFVKFKDTVEALAATTALIEGKIGKSMKKAVKLIQDDVQGELAVSDAILGKAIKEKFDLPCVSNQSIHELMRAIRANLDSLLTDVSKKEITAMSLGLAHGLSRYKLKFSPDKIDTMIVQAIGLLDDLDKELNNYTMRAREWYGWHFPELGKLIPDHTAFAKTVLKIGDRVLTQKTDLSDVLPEEIADQVKVAAEISMGTEVAEEDIINIKFLCEQVLSLSESRTQLHDYLKNRMMALAPNLTVLLGELVGARLISKAGSLINLAKHPSSTVQILGAEKALFRALKTKHETPKYGLIYHASLVGQSTPKNKGKISRMLAAKVSLAVRYDALGEETDSTMGLEHRAKVEKRLAQLEQGGIRRISGAGKQSAQFKSYGKSVGSEGAMPMGGGTQQYDVKQDFTSPTGSSGNDGNRKRKLGDLSQLKGEPVEDVKEEVIEEPEKKKKKKHKKEAVESEEPETTVEIEEPVSEKKSKKKKKHRTEEDD